jgi:hypothetical protein
MKSRIIVLSVITMMLLPVLPGVVAQPEPSIGNWELGVDYPKEDDSNPFVVSIGGSALINFWVANDGLFNIKVTFEYEVPWDAQFSGPESATIGPGANTSFSMMVAGIDVYSIDAMTKDAFTISANLEERSGIPAVIPENQEKTGDLEIPEIFQLKVDIADAVGPINAGTDTVLRVTVTNRGNARDKIREIDISDDCPLLTTDGGLDVLLSRNIEKGASTTADLKVMVSESHPKRNCRIEVTIASEGADGAQLSTDFTRVNVEPPPTQQNDPDDPDDSTDPVEVVTSNLPAPGLSVVLSILIGALIARTSRRF